MATLASFLLLTAACGSRSTIDDSGTGLPPGAVAPGEGAGDGDELGGPQDDENPSNPGGLRDPNAPADPVHPSGPEGFGPVCLDFLEMFNGAPDTKACLACISDAQRGPCRLEQEAAIETEPPCGQPNDCASVMCQCTPKGCPSGLCPCIEKCMRYEPQCLDRWTSLWSCIHRNCEERCAP